MAKTKNKKKNLADAASLKKSRESKKKSTNPFEIHINRDKQKVLGRKSKDDRGLPGIARSKAINKRKRTLLHEFTQKNKDNVFMDKRIGERNATMSQEEKAMARYAAEKIKAHKKKNIFSLNDEEILTHRGQTLEEIEKFDDPKSEDEFSDDDDYKGGQLGKKFVSDAHFGGGLLSNSNEQSSGKQLIQDLIAESKKRKAEQQNIREQTIELTKKLDSEWRDLAPIMASTTPKVDKSIEKPKADDYDIAVRELQFERRGKPSDRLKSEEDIMKEEKEKLEALESDRLARMKGFTDDSDKGFKHKSADDLDDGFIVEKIDEEPLAYDENGMVLGNSNNSEPTDSIIKDDNSIDENDSGKLQTNKLNINGDKSESENEENSGAEESGEDDDEEEEEEDDLDDLKESELSSDEEEQEQILNDKKSNNLSTTVEQSHESTKLSISDKESDNNTVNNESRIKDIREDLQRRKEIMEKARQELPYTYSAPSNFDELEELLMDKNAEYQSIILERIIKCNHWSLNENNRDNMCKLFDYLLQYIVKCCTRVTEEEDIVKCFLIIDRLCPHLYDLAQINASNTATCVQTLLKEKHENFEKNQKKYPGLDTLILFKIVSLLFPTSDFRHPVVTPCLVFMSQILLRCRVKTKTDISRGLFIVTLMLEYTVLSKRFLPSSINFLRGIIYLATIKPLPSLPKIVPPFKRVGNFSNLLILEESQKSLNIELVGAHMKAHDLSSNDIDDNFKVRVVLTAINLLDEFKCQLEELDAVYSIFEPIIKLLKMNSWKNYPKNVRNHVKQIRNNLEILSEKKLEYLIPEKKKPKALRLYEPKIVKVYDGKQFKPMSKQKQERAKLMAKVKKETKGAMREMRRDTAFLAKVQIKQQIRNDEERKRKVREIYGDAALQQGELNKMKRKK
ncbi:hypothetical protein PV327_000728 [Microctonus hyperodae]|uniref:Nucleolar protein 14 n=1 Tax=Microctonus hyperodae TaxID=165561 RepID=A0AA39G742_MICHY|nr:hypothetical protein PV327_000728 [Microctonus hyperodae]